MLTTVVIKPTQLNGTQNIHKYEKTHGYIMYLNRARGREGKNIAKATMVLNDCR